MSRLSIPLYALISFLLITSCTTSIEYGNDKKSNTEHLTANADFTFSTDQTLPLTDIPSVSAPTDWSDLYQKSEQDTFYLGRFRTSDIDVQASTDGDLFVVPASSVSSAAVKNTIQKKTSSPVITELPEISFSLLYNNLYKMGDWSPDGTPRYFTTADEIQTDLLNDIDASLPEGRPVPQFNADYLTGEKMDTEITELADVWITFVHEGAGWKNTLGYYSYDLSNPPQTADDIDSLVVIFPNVSFSPAGGLGSGDKVYLGRFKPNTGIGWFLMPNAWSSGTIRDVSQVKYSDPSYNTYTGEEYRQHMVVLNDENRELLLLGFEDTTRPGGDNDFNDAIFYISANPYTAVETAGIKPVKKAVDSDNDGVYDHIDEFPEDEERVSRSWYPAQNSYATLLVEDLWPQLGDYDFNDLVLDYNFEYVKNESNQIKDIKITYRIKAVGGNFGNGFGFEFGTSADNIKSVSGSTVAGELFTLTSEGVEDLGSSVLVPLFENAHNRLTTPAGYGVTNVLPEQPFKNHYQRTITVTFNSAVPSQELGTAPHNPAMIVDGERGREVHLKNQLPTPFVNSDLLGSGDDRYNESTGLSYQNSAGLPWMLNISRAIPHMIEGKDFTNGYLRFSEWATSNGTSAADWYLNRSQHRNPAFLYE